MAKNKVEIDVKVDDKGTTEKLALNSKKAGKGLDDTAKSARSADRNLKGAANASSNTTKNFSKMAQGTNGLVAAYATFAAQVFALTAAFGFFKRAGDLAVLEQGQKAYAAATGTAMRVLTRDIIAATGAQVTFRDAAQAAAIGTASGLSTDQLIKLGKAAKDTSAVLGRDVTDSFNRLVRGVTKAEPELLDELGIVLRLKTATEEYAATLNKSADDLTAFERSQAVANNVLTQAEEKYSRILAITGGGGENPFNQLGVALDELVMKIQKFLLPIATSVSKVLTDMPYLAGITFAMFISGPLKAMGFSLAEVGQKAHTAARVHNIALIKNKNAIEAVNVSLQQQAVLLQQNAALALQQGGAVGGGKSKLLQKVSEGGYESLNARDRATLNRATSAALKNVNQHGIVTKGIYTGVRESVVRDMQRGFKQIENGEKALVSKSKLNTMKMEGHYLKTSATIQSATSKMIKGLSKLMGLLGWIGIAVMVFGALKEAFTVKKELTDSEKAAKRFRDRIAGLNKELEHYLAIQKELTSDGSSAALMGLGSSIGRQIGQLGIGANIVKAQKQYHEVAALRIQQEKDLENQTKMTTKSGAGGYIVAGPQGTGSVISKEAAESQEAIKRQLDGMKLLEEQSGISYTAFQKYSAALQDPNIKPEALNQAASAAQELGALMEGLPRQMKVSDDGIQSFVNSFAPLNQAEQSMKDITAEMETYAKLNTQGGLTKPQQDRLGILKKQLAWTKKLNDAEHIRKMNLQAASLLVKESMAIEIPALQKVATLGAQANLTTVKYLNLQQDLSELENDIVKTNEKGEKQWTEAQKRKQQTLKASIQLAEEEEDQAYRKLKLANELVNVELELYSLKIDQKPLQMAKTLLDFDKQTLDIARRRKALRDKEAKNRMDSAMRDMQGVGGRIQNEEYRRAKLELAAAKKAEEGDIISIEKEFAFKKKMQEADNALQDLKWQLLQVEMDKLAIERQNIAEQFRLEAFKQADKGNIQGPGGYLELRRRSSAIGTLGAGGEFTDKTMNNLRATLSDIITKLPERGQALIDLLDTEEVAALAEVGINIDALTDKVDRLSPIEQTFKEIGETIQNSLGDAFASIIDGSMKAKDAFKNMANSILQSIGQIVAKKLAVSVLTGMGLSDLLGIEKSRYGSIVSNGKKLPGYAVGGIAKGPQAGYPVMMHGTEAIVPLPNGKSIPVEMKSDGSQQNNITVNISTDGSTESENSSGPDAENLGKAVAQAVQKELQNQKRSGGILSPYGVA